MIADALIVGAGIAGLLALSELRRRGLRALCIDKGRGPGGRMSVRREGERVWDHGAQFFTARSSEFRQLAADWEADGLIRVWARGFPGGPREHPPEDGHPRYVGVGGMNAVAKALADRAGDAVRTGLQASRVTWASGGSGSSAGIPAQPAGPGLWRVDCGPHSAGRSSDSQAATSLQARALLLTPPAPQSLALLEAGSVGVPTSIRESLAAIAYEPCIAVLAALDGPSGIAPPGAIQFQRAGAGSLTSQDGGGERILAWIADHRQRGISEAPTVTLHGGGAFSARLLEEPERAAEELLEAARPLLSARIITHQVHRWRYAAPVALHPERHLLSELPGPIAFAGDGFREARVEGAALSGLSAARALADLLGTRAQETKK